MRDAWCRVTCLVSHAARGREVACAAPVRCHTCRCHTRRHHNASPSLIPTATATVDCASTGTGPGSRARSWPHRQPCVGGDTCRAEAPRCIPAGCPHAVRTSLRSRCALCRAHKKVGRHRRQPQLTAHTYTCKREALRMHWYSVGEVGRDDVLWAMPLRTGTRLHTVCMYRRCAAQTHRVRPRRATARRRRKKTSKMA